MSSSFSIKFGAGGFPLRIYQLAAEFNLMFWKIKAPEQPTNLCPYMQTLFFFPLAAVALLGMAYWAFFSMIGTIVSNVLGSSAYLIVVWGAVEWILAIAGGIVLIIAGVKGFERLMRWRDKRTHAKLDTWSLSLEAELEQDIATITHKRVSGSSFMEVLMAWWQTLHDKTCIPIKVIDQSNVGGN